MPTRRLLLSVVAVVPLLAGSAGQSCEALSTLTAQREEARAAHGWLVATGTAPADVTEQADADLHVPDRQVYDLEQSCQDR